MSSKNVQKRGRVIHIQKFPHHRAQSDCSHTTPTAPSISEPASPNFSLCGSHHYPTTPRLLNQKEPLHLSRHSLPLYPSNDTRWYRIVSWYRVTSRSWPHPLLATAKINPLMSGTRTVFSQILVLPPILFTVGVVWEAKKSLTYGKHYLTAIKASVCCQLCFHPKSKTVPPQHCTTY